MATSRLLSRPPTGRPAQRSWSCSFRCSSSKHTPTQPASLDSKDQDLNRGASFTRASSGNPTTLFATEAGVSQQGSDLVSLWKSDLPLKPTDWKLNPSQTQRIVERAIVDCRFFTFLAVVGSLLGSILCFVEGFAMVLRTYFGYFEAVLHKQGHRSTVELLVEAIDVFLVGTAMLIFGIGTYAMFFRSKNLNYQRQQPRKPLKSNISGLFHLEMLPSWLRMESVSEAKTRMGHAVLMILQVGMLDKFKSVPLVTGFDLASFAGAVLLSSASIFCLSKLTRPQAQEG